MTRLSSTVSRLVGLTIVLAHFMPLAAQVASEPPQSAVGEKGEPIGMVLGKPLYERDLQKDADLSAALEWLVIAPLTDHYCKQTAGLEPEEEIAAKIKNGASRAKAMYFVRRARLQKHLYDKHGGRVLVSMFGPTAVDGHQKWLDERERAGEFEITDPKTKAALGKFWTKDGAGKLVTSPAEIKAAFDVAWTEGLIDSFVEKGPPADVNALINRVQEGNDVADAVKTLRQITGLDFGDGLDRHSRRDWRAWWICDQRNLEHAADGVREFVIRGAVTEPGGKPVPGATVQLHEPSTKSRYGRYLLAHTIADSHGRYVLTSGFRTEGRPSLLNLKVTLSAIHGPMYKQRDDDVITRALSPNQLGKEHTGTEVIYPWTPVDIDVVLRPTVQIHAHVLDANGDSLVPKYLLARYGPLDEPLTRDADLEEDVMLESLHGDFSTSLISPQRIQFCLLATDDSRYLYSTTQIKAKTSGTLLVELKVIGNELKVTLRPDDRPDVFKKLAPLAEVEVVEAK